MNDLVLNVYHAIGGTPHQKIIIIAKWLDEVRSLPPEISSISIVKQISDKCEKEDQELRKSLLG